VKAKLKGRHWIALWLAAFLLMALAVVRRQTEALQTARDLQALRKTRGALEARLADVQAEKRRAESRAVLVPLAEQRFGLRLPQDSEITILQDLRPH